MVGLNSKLLVTSGCMNPTKRRENARNQGNKLRPDNNCSRKDTLALAKAAHMLCCFWRKCSSVFDQEHCSYKMNYRKIVLWHHFVLMDWWCIRKKSENMDVGYLECWQKYFWEGRSGVMSWQCLHAHVCARVCVCMCMCGFILCMYVWVCACMCVWEREREREREHWYSAQSTTMVTLKQVRKIEREAEKVYSN